MHEYKHEQVIAAWAKAGAELSIEVVAPFHLEDGGVRYSYLAFLPDFGGGILLASTSAPSFAIDNALVKMAKLHGLAYSFLNVDEYTEFRRDTFMEALLDWGFTGPVAKRPGWANAPPI